MPMKPAAHATDAWNWYSSKPGRQQTACRSIPAAPDFQQGVARKARHEIVHMADTDIAEVLVERGRLVGQGFDQGIDAAAAQGLGLYLAQAGAAQALPAQVLPDP